MTNDETDESNAEGKEVDKPVETTDKPLNIVDEARAIRDEIRQVKEELKTENDRKEKLQSEEMLGGTSGGNVEAKKISPEDKKTNNAKQFFKGTALGDAIDKANG